MFTRTVFVQLADGTLLRIGSESFVIHPLYGNNIEINGRQATEMQDYNSFGERRSEAVKNDAAALAMEIASRIDESGEEKGPIIWKHEWHRSWE